MTDLGAHFRYCYLPSMVLKETWITDHPGALNMGDWCSKSLKDIKDQQCYYKKPTTMGYGPEHIVPYALAQCAATSNSTFYFGAAPSKSTLLHHTRAVPCDLL